MQWQHRSANSKKSCPNIGVLANFEMQQKHDAEFYAARAQHIRETRSDFWKFPPLAASHETRGGGGISLLTIFISSAAAMIFLESVSPRNKTPAEESERPITQAGLAIILICHSCSSVEFLKDILRSRGEFFIPSASSPSST